MVLAFADQAQVDGCVASRRFRHKAWVEAGNQADIDCAALLIAIVFGGAGEGELHMAFCLVGLAKCIGRLLGVSIVEGAVAVGGPFEIRLVIDISVRGKSTVGTGLSVVAGIED